MTDNQVEVEIQTKGLITARVTLLDIEANIAREYFFTAGDAVFGREVAACGTPVTSDIALNSLTFCVLVLKNGFTVTGESACVSPGSFNSEQGRNIARQNAVQKIWPLMGYALKQQLHEAQ